MNNNKLLNIKTLGISALCATAALAFRVEQVTPPSIADCEAAYENREHRFRQMHGYNLTEEQRRAVIRSLGERRACIDTAKDGPYPVLALRHFGK